MVGGEGRPSSSRPAIPTWPTSQERNLHVAHGLQSPLTLWEQNREPHQRPQGGHGVVVALTIRSTDRRQSHQLEDPLPCLTQFHTACPVSSIAGRTAAGPRWTPLTGPTGSRRRARCHGPSAWHSPTSWPPSRCSSSGGRPGGVCSPGRRAPRPVSLTPFPRRWLTRRWPTPRSANASGRSRMSTLLDSPTPCLEARRSPDTGSVAVSGRTSRGYARSPSWRSWRSTQNPHLAGGFVGVDVFFVISGIPHHRPDARRVHATGQPRPRRLLRAPGPPDPSCGGVVLVFVAVSAPFLMPPLRQADVVKDVLGSAAYLVNWRFIGAQTNYMAAGRDRSPLLHFWSLASKSSSTSSGPCCCSVARRRPTAARDGRWRSPSSWPSRLGRFFLCPRLDTTQEPLAYMGSPARAWEFGPAPSSLRWCGEGWRMPGLLAMPLGWCGLVRRRLVGPQL